MERSFGTSIRTENEADTVFRFPSITIDRRCRNAGKPVTVAGYLLLIAAFIGYLVVIIIGLVDMLPEGIVGLLAITGFGLLLIKVIKDRLTNKEDSYYSKNVKL
ncbi:hypothetical protein ACFLX5_06110 [Chloroflexota bacterium]